MRGVTNAIKKWKIQGGWGGGGPRKVPSVVGVWMFSGNTQSVDAVFVISRIIKVNVRLCVTLANNN